MELSKIELKIQKQEEELKKLKQIEKETRKKERLRKKEFNKKHEMQKQILIGKCIMNLMKKDPKEAKKVMDALSLFLKTNKDRALFDLEPIKIEKIEKEG